MSIMWLLLKIFVIGQFNLYLVRVCFLLLHVLILQIMAQENYNSTDSESSNYSLYSLEQSLENQIELKEGNFYVSHEGFVIAVKNYTKQQGFQVRLEKYEKNAAEQVQKSWFKEI